MRMVKTMIREWHLQRADRIDGPFTLDELRHMLAGGSLNAAELVRQGEGGAWVPVRAVAGAFEAPPTAALITAPSTREPSIGLDAPFSEWGLASLITGSALLIVTQLTVQIGHPIREPGGSRTLGFLLAFAFQFLLLIGNAASVAAGVMGMLGYLKQRQRLPLNLAGAAISVLSLLLWLVTMIALMRAMD
jgi:GYF domain 2